jgi:hypothetical protein
MHLTCIDAAERVHRFLLHPGPQLSVFTCFRLTRQFHFMFILSWDLYIASWISPKKYIRPAVETPIRGIIPA